MKTVKILHLFCCLALSSLCLKPASCQDEVQITITGKVLRQCSQHGVPLIIMRMIGWPYEQDDDDESPELADAWERWRKRVDLALERRIEQYVASVRTERVEHLTEVHYLVTNEGQITTVWCRPIKPADATFDALVMDAINSLNGDPVLTFPERTARAEIKNSLNITQPPDYGMFCCGWGGPIVRKRPAWMDKPRRYYRYPPVTVVAN